MKADYIIRQGEELALSLMVLEGDVSPITTVSAVLKSAGPNGSVPSITTPSVATFEVDDIDGGWSFIIDGGATALLKPGFYITNAKLDLLAGGPLKTDPVLIEIRPSVT